MVKVKSEKTGIKPSNTNSQNNSLFILKQDSLGQDSFTKNEITKTLHLLVKNLPFTLRVGSKNLDLKKLNISAKLVYDFDEEVPTSLREVETLKSSPLDYVCHIDETGTSLAMEVKIRVLSSFHEGAYFRIRVMAFDKEDKTISYECFSEPIKVLSKQSQVRKISEKKETALEPKGKSLKRKRSEEEALSPNLETPSNVGLLSPPIQEILQKLEKQQRTQSLLLQQVLQNQLSSPSPAPLAPSPALLAPSPDLAPPSELEQAFGAFISAFQRSSSDERKTKIRKLLKQLNTPELDYLSEFVNLYTAEGLFPLSETTNPLQSSSSSSPSLSSPSSPSSEKECSHKHQLDSFDSFYSQFLHDPSPFLGSGEISSLI